MLKHYLSRCYAGRLNRKNYLLAQAVYPILLLFVALPMFIVPMEVIDSQVVYQVLFIVYSLCVYAWYLSSGIGATVRRCHDINRSGWYSLLLLVPVVGLYVGVELLVRGAVEPNKFGPVDQQVSVKKILALE